jgi:cytochrome c553
MNTYQAGGLAMVLSMSIFGSVQAADIGAGKERFNQCISCHGAAAQGSGIFPALAGRDAGEIAGLLKRYRANEVDSAMAAMMVPQAMNLSDQEILDLAAYLSSL